MNGRTLIISLLLVTGAASADQTAVFNEAKSFGQSQTQGVYNATKSGVSAGTIPGYGTTPAETQYYQGGQGTLSTPGVAKVQNCAAYSAGSDKIANQECEAVNFLAKNPQIRPQFNIDKNDPMFSTAKAIGNNAESIFESLRTGNGIEHAMHDQDRDDASPVHHGDLLLIEGSWHGAMHDGPHRQYRCRLELSV